MVQNSTPPDSGIAKSRIAWFVPKPIEGSGGHRTILQNIKALEDAGHECHIYLEDPPYDHDVEADPKKRLAQQCNDFEKYFGFTSQHMHLGFTVKDSYDLLFATAWFTAPFVACVNQPCLKAYFVQDYEAYFMPVSDGYLRAENSYRLGLNVISIGRWLTQRLAKEAGCPATYFEFCADSAVYRPDPAVARERAVCAIYQPEKPRRCPQMLIDALGLLKAHKPDVKIYLYGTRDKPTLPFEHEHLGLLDVKSCAALYNRCSVGMCISATNPSRIPFEMMACGLTVIDVYRDNNLYDMPENGVLLANARPEALARAAALLLDDAPRRAAMGAYAREFMKPRTLEYGFEQFVGAVEDLLARRTPNWNARARQIQPLYSRSAQLPTDHDPLTGQPIGTRPTPRQSELVSQGVQTRLEAMEKLDRIYGARSWQTVQRIKHNPLYRLYANSAYGPGWDRIDPKEDPSVVLARVQQSRSYKLILAAKGNPLSRVFKKGTPSDLASDPFQKPST